MSSDEPIKDLYAPMLELEPDMQLEELIYMCALFAKLMVSGTSAESRDIAGVASTMCNRLVNQIVRLKHRLGESTTFSPTLVHELIDRGNKSVIPAPDVAKVNPEYN